MRRQALAALVAAVVPISAAPSFAENRVALVIGNGAYEHAPRLPNPANDAADVAAALKRSGFETILATDLNKAGMDEVTIRFARAAWRTNSQRCHPDGMWSQSAPRGIPGWD
jgi:Caspase domain